MVQQTRLPLEIQPQPTDVACGPTCLHAVYRYFGDKAELAEVIDTVPRLEHGGTLAVLLGVHALGRGYHARLYTFNLHMFDPSWFPSNEGGPADPALLRNRLAKQAEAKGEGRDERFAAATEGYLNFLEAGGEILMEDVSSALISSHLRDGKPLITGLSSTYLYRVPREYGPNDDSDDIRGEPAGHFVVLCGHHGKSRRLTIADPLTERPGDPARVYEAPMSRVVAAIMLGVLTHDANLLVIEPADGSGPSARERRRKNKRKSAR